MSAARFPLLRALAIPLVILLAPLELGAVVHELAGTADGYNRVVVLLAMDLGLLLLAVTTRADDLDRRLLASPATAIVVAMVVFGALALPFHPSVRGVALLVRIVLAGLLLARIRALSTDDYRTQVVIPITIAAGLQSIVSLGQVVAQAPLGLTALGERTVFHQFGASVGAQGTTIHPYVTAGFAMVATLTITVHLVRDRPPRRGWLLAGLGLAAVPLGITYSRMGALAFLALLGFLGWGAVRRKAVKPVITVIAAAVLVPALVWSGGWLDRAGDSVGGDLNTVTSNRVALTEQAIDIALEHPFVGVGPGLYTDYLEREVAGLERYDTVHTVPLVLAAENGIAAGAVTVVVLVWLGLRALRRGPLAAAVFGGFIPFVMLDKFPYVHPNGLVMLAIWLVLIDRAAEDVEVSTDSGALRQRV